MDELKRYDLVDRYLRNELTADELLQFEETIKSDQLLQQELAEQKMVGELFFSNEIKELQNQVKTDVDQILNKPSSNWKWYLSGVIITGIATTLFLNQTDDTPKSVYKPIATISSNHETKTNNTTIPISEKKHSAQLTPVVTTTEPQKETPTPALNDELERSNQPIVNTITPTQVVGTNDSVITYTPEEEKPKTEAKQVNEVKCNLKTVTALVEIKHEYPGKYNGEITIKNVNKELTIPVKYRLTELSDDFQFESSFLGLTNGKYHLQLRDADNCIINNREIITVKTINCSESSEYLFNSLYDAEVVIPIVSTAYKMEIKNKVGQIIWESNEAMEDQYIWTGKNRNEEFVESGLYLYTILNENNTSCIGSITVVRN